MSLEERITRLEKSIDMLGIMLATVILNDADEIDHQEMVDIFDEIMDTYKSKTYEDDKPVKRRPYCSYTRYSDYIK